MTYSKAFTTLWFWRSEIVGKFQKSCQKQSNVDAPWCVIYIPLLPYSHRCTRTLYGSIRHIGSVIHISVGSCVARFDRMGISYEPQNVKRATVCRASRLNRNTKHNTRIVRYKTMGILWIDTIKFPLFFISPNVIFYSCMWFLIGKWENNWVADVENVFFMSNVQISWKFIIYWITRCLYTWNNIKNSKALWLIRLLQVVLPPP